MTVRFASSVMDYCMGLSMAQIYDPQYGTQSTVSSGLYYTFMALIFFATNGHLRLFSIFYTSAELIPFGTVSLRPEIMEVAAAAFCQSIVMGMQFAFPVIAMELLSEAAMGILMRVVPQINVFAVNFQVKILVGMFMFLLIFSPMADRLGVILEEMYGIIGTARSVHGRSVGGEVPWHRTAVRKRQSRRRQNDGKMRGRKETFFRAGMSLRWLS